MTATQQPIVHRQELNLAYLISEVPEQQLGDYDALFYAALRDELEQSGYDPGSFEFGKIRDDGDDEHGFNYLVDVTINGEPQVCRLTALGEELAAILTFRERILDFAEFAMQRLAGPGRQVLVGDCLPSAPDRVGVAVVEEGTENVIWQAQPLATPAAVLAAVDEGIERTGVRASGSSAHAGAAPGIY